MDEQPSARRTTPQGLVKGSRTRRIVVSPDDVLQRDTRDFRQVSLESVIMRYVLVSAAIIGAVMVCGFFWLAFLH
jgi:hypothetical protein